MKASVALFCALLAGSSIYAQNLYIATQQAQRVSNQNTAEQQRIQNAAGDPRQAGSAASAPGAAPVDPALQATLSNITGLQSDLAAFTSDTDKPDPSQKVSLLNDLSQAAQSKRAASDSLKKLATDLMTVLAGKQKLAGDNQKRLAGEVHAVFNASHLTDAQEQMIFANVQKILTDAGVTTDDAATIIADLKEIADETK